MIQFQFLDSIRIRYKFTYRTTPKLLLLYAKIYYILCEQRQLHQLSTHL